MRRFILATRCSRTWAKQANLRDIDYGFTSVTRSIQRVCPAGAAIADVSPVSTRVAIVVRLHR